MEEPPVPVFFLSDSTGISAETMGNALLIQFPDRRFERRLIPFIATAEEARKVVAVLDAAMDGPVTPLAFTTAATDEVREVLHTSRCPIIDFFEMHMQKVEAILGAPGARVAARLHGVGDIKRYNSRMQAIEYAIEHDDGQSLRALDRAEVILVAPSRCGKTPTTMYLALQHGIFVANYPLLDEDLETTALPRPLADLGERCFGLIATPARLSEVRQQRRPNSDLRVARAVRQGAAPCRRAVQDQRHPGHQLHHPVRGGDVHPDPAVPGFPDPVRKKSVMSNVLWFSSLGMKDLDQVGGKNASLGEMVGNLASAGVRVPDGFATTADAYRRFVAQEGLAETIVGLMAGLDTDDVIPLADVGQAVRAAVIAQPLPADVEADVRAAYAQLAEGNPDASFAVRSSATAEDLPDASFAGQQETFLNIRGVERVLQAVKEVFASLYNDRAIAYRVHHGFEHETVALSAGVQRMVRSDVGASGVMFTMDTESGFDGRRLHHLVVRAGGGGGPGRREPGRVLRLQARPARRPAGDPQAGGRRQGDQDGLHLRRRGGEHHRVRRRRPRRPALLSLTDAEVEELARHALVIEDHYGRPMDIEWGKDGTDGRLYILQARPETVKSRQSATTVTRYRITEGGTPAGRGTGDRPEDRRRPGAGARLGRPDARLPAPATCWSPT